MDKKKNSEREMNEEIEEDFELSVEKSGSSDKPKSSKKYSSSKSSPKKKSSKSSVSEQYSEENFEEVILIFLEFIKQEQQPCVRIDSFGCLTHFDLSTSLCLKTSSKCPQ